MTHHIIKLYVIISYFLCWKRQTNKQYTLLTVILRCMKSMQEMKPSSNEYPVRANGGKPIALLLVSGLIPYVQ